MEIEALGYAGFHAPSLEDWVGFGTRFLGLQMVDQARRSLSFRMDDRKQRVFIHEDADRRPFFGWEVADVAALASLAARLERAAIAVQPMPAATAGQRHVRDGLLFEDPAGNRLEAFCGAEIASEPFRPGRTLSGFVTGPLGVGHAVLTTPDIESDLRFYHEVLGFRISDYLSHPFRATFLHVNPRHHSLALIERGARGVHHLMIELFNLDDVGQGYDLALREEGRIATTLGRHTNDYMTSFYANTPSGFLVETGWGGRVIDPETWAPYEVTDGPSLWGHDRKWLSPEARTEAERIRLDIAARGVRAPVQVSEGNYQINRGVCPWWDSVSAAGREIA
jgi:2,3-dihydroxybiphenyl 1,2-dioxygenase